MGFFQTSGILNRRGFFGGASAPAYDSDAQAYITAVENADNQSLETGVKDAINTFVVGCKTDGIWSALKAACILMGARTIDGAIVDLPTATTIATNNNFVSGDYNRETGLLGNGTTKFINSGRNNNADPQNDNHNSVYVTSLGSNVRAYIGCGSGTDNGTNQIAYNTTFQTRNRGTASNFLNSGTVAVGFWGSSRSQSASYSRRVNKTASTATYNSSVPFNGNILVFCRGTTASPNLHTDGRISFYSIGTSLDLALLDSRLETLETEIAAAVP